MILFLLDHFIQELKAPHQMQGQMTPEIKDDMHLRAYFGGPGGSILSNSTFAKVPAMVILQQSAVTSEISCG